MSELSTRQGYGSMKDIHFPLPAPLKRQFPLLMCLPTFFIFAASGWLGNESS